jgi:outer membrane receptor protein involved in Fe transport
MAPPMRSPTLKVARQWFLCVASMLASAVLAQGVTGSALTGKITAKEGNAPLSGVTLRITNTATGATFTATSTGAGVYLLDNVPPGGPYNLEASVDGFYSAKRTGLQLALGQRLSLDIQLRQLEAIEEEVVVVGKAITPLEDKSRTGASTTVNATEMSRLPLQGRNFTDLVATAPQASGGSFSGQNNRFNNIQIDGAAYNDLFGLASGGTPGGQAGAKPLSMEAIDTFVVQVSPFDVRYGNFAGGMVNAVTKSGTNDFHGSIFTYFQNKVLAGNQADPTFLGYNTVQFGGSLGGPILKDRAHFFVATDLQERQSAFGNQFQMSGDPADDLARVGFTTAEVDRFNGILSNYGVPNAGTALGTNLGNPDRNVFAKVSTSLIPSSYLELSYNFVTGQQDNLTRAPTSPTVPGRIRDGYQLSNSGYGQATSSHVGRAKLVSSFLGGKLSNELLTGFSILRDERATSLDIPLILVKAGRLAANDTWLAAGQERFSQENELDQDVFQLQDSVTYSLGQHQIAVGTSNEYLRIRNSFLQAATGAWTFDSLNDFEAGIASAFQRRFGVDPAQEAGTARFSVFQLGAYAQDTWTPMSNLTITPGVRLDVPFLSPGVTNQALLNNAAFPIDTGRIPTGNILWSPRLGVNWDVDGTATTVVRGGTGIFSGRPPYVWVSNAYAVNGLSQVEVTCTRTSGARLVPAFTIDPAAQPYDCLGGTTLPTPPTNQGEIDYFAPDTKYPQNFRVAVGADRRLPFGLTASVDLLYTTDVNGWYTSDENLVYQGQSGEDRPIYGAFAPTGAFRATPTRVDGTNLLQAVKVWNKNGGRVLSGTITVQEQFQNLIDASVSYTYTDARDRISMTSSQALSNFQFAPLDGDLQNRNVRPSAFDRTHRLVISGTATLPYNVTAGLIYTGQSGTPYTWTVNGDVNADGINGNDLVFVPADASQITLAPGSNFQALSDFIESQGCLRNAKGGFVTRGACRNPWQSFLNLRVGWITPEFVKGQKGEVQLDLFNLLNLINPHWGVFEQAAQFENHASSFLRATGYDAANNRPIYAFTAPAQVKTIVLSPTSSRWRIQLGARYAF